ncbi:MAG: RNA polymerase sigma factor, partial [bacterium]|nr:RNA polymerase sigma factor [bacterium]
DQSAWREIYDNTCQSLFNFLCYQTGDRDTARDLLQETYLTALEKLDSYQGGGTLLSWLRTVALRKCLD